MPYADTGFRLDDFFLILALFGLIGSYLLGTIKLVRPIAWLLCFAVWSFSALCLNIGVGNSFLQGILFSLRPLEYVGGFFLGYLFASYGFSFYKYIFAYVIYAFLLSAVMYFTGYGGVSDFSPDRFYANTNGPYELAPIMAFSAFYFINENKKYGYIMAIISFVVLICTLSRVTIFASVITVVISRYKDFFKKENIFFLLIGLIFFTTLISVYPGPLSAFQKRISLAFSSDTITGVNELWEKAEPVSTHQEYISTVYNKESDNKVFLMQGDHSALIRLKRWFTILKSIPESNVHLLAGFGPSFASVAVDGYFVRVLVETGVLGLLVFSGFFFSIVRYGLIKKDYTLCQFSVVLLLTSCFIDIFVASKVMFLFWFYMGVRYFSLLPELRSSHRPA